MAAADPQVVRDGADAGATFRRANGGVGYAYVGPTSFCALGRRSEPDNGAPRNLAVQGMFNRFATVLLNA